MMQRAIAASEEVNILTEDPWGIHSIGLDEQGLKPCRDS